MKSRLTLIFATLVVLLGAMTWVVRDRNGTAPVPVMATGPVLTFREPAVEQVAVPATLPAAATPRELPAPPDSAAPMVHVDSSGELRYVARARDTVSQLAIALLGSDSREHRDAVIAANPTLLSNPDRVLTGLTYSIVPPPASPDGNAAVDSGAADTARVPVAAGAPNEPAGVQPTAGDPSSGPASGGRRLRYTAQPGDTVGTLAAGLLGADTAANREAITSGNASLRRDPDHLVSGQTYTIVAPNGLAAHPGAAATGAPAPQPDADDAARLGVGRVLRYTARAGDTVSKLAVALLGRDTPANRDLIVQSNFSLKQDPDHLVAGRTYWINAPTEPDLTPE